MIVVKCCECWHLHTCMSSLSKHPSNGIWQKNRRSTKHIEEVYYICYPSLHGQQYPPLSFFMARVCANTLEGNIKGTHQQHGLGISLHLCVCRVIKPPPSEVHHKPFQIQSFSRIAGSMLSRAVSIQLIMISRQCCLRIRGNQLNPPMMTYKDQQRYPEEFSQISTGSEASFGLCLKVVDMVSQWSTWVTDLGASQAPVWQSWEELVVRVAAEKPVPMEKNDELWNLPETLDGLMCFTFRKELLCIQYAYIYTSTYV